MARISPPASKKCIHPIQNGKYTLTDDDSHRVAIASSSSPVFLVQANAINMTQNPWKPPSIHRCNQPCSNLAPYTQLQLVHADAKSRQTRRQRAGSLATEAVQGATLALERVHDIERGDGLALGMLGVGDSVADDALEEGFEHAASLFVDHGRNTLDATTTSQTADGGLGDALDVVTENLAMAFGSALSKTFATFSASSHDDKRLEKNLM